MPVLKKEFELNNGKKVWVRQASGLEKLKVEARQAKVFRKCRHFGADPTSWSEEQQEEFATLLEDEGAGVSDQINAWIPNCILDEDTDVNTLTSEELRTLLEFVRGDDLEGAVPLDNSTNSHP
tara:strand:+ start:1361 stop:1729 length:369 start_codon:yes stop_codon:yes gene_type:complete